MAYVFNTTVKVPIFKSPFVSTGIDKPIRRYVLEGKLRGYRKPA